MNRIIITLILIVIGFQLTAQTFREEGKETERSGEIETLFSKHRSISGYGQFDLNTTKLLNQTGLILGGQGGIILDKMYQIGLGGYGISTPIRLEMQTPGNNYELVGGYGGLALGYIFKPTKPVHITLPLFLGIGGLDVIDSQVIYSPDQQWEDNSIERTMFYVVEPGAMLQLNITRFFRLAVGAGYRLTYGVNLDASGIKDEDTSGMSYNVSFKFGNF